MSSVLECDFMQKLDQEIELYLYAEKVRECRKAYQKAQEDQFYQDYGQRQHPPMSLKLRIGIFALFFGFFWFAIEMGTRYWPR